MADPVPSWPQSLLFVGCGNMAGAMLDGWLAAGIDPSRFVVVDPGRKTVPPGVTLLDELPQRQFDAILLGVKPQMLGDIAPRIALMTDESTAILSILAGVELATLRTRFPEAGAVVRVMPNLAASLGKSPIALAGEGLDEAGHSDIAAFMDLLGTAEWIGEDTFDLVTALAGSGPGFVYRFIDALASGAASLGLDPAQAERLAVAMVEGAGALAAGSPHSPGELARRVASPGGVTQVGLDVLDRDEALLQLIEATLRGARDRSAEMAAEARG